MRTNIILWLLVIFSYGCKDMSDILPNATVKYSKKGDCGMFRSFVYDIESFTINSEFYNYPISGFWDVNSDYEITKWIKLSEYEDPTMDDYLISLSEINGCNLFLSKELKEGKNQIYFAGCFKYMINSEGKKYKSYDYYTIFDSKNKELYVFEYKDK